MQALIFCAPQFWRLLRNSLGRGDFFTDPFPDVVLRHHHSCVPKLILRLHDVATRFGLET